jgi:hypothetical protein
MQYPQWAIIEEFIANFSLACKGKHYHRVKEQ